MPALLAEPRAAWATAASRSRLERITAEALTFVGRGRCQAPLLITPLFGVLGALPWVARAEQGGLSALVSALCFSVAAISTAASWPRRVRFHVERSGRQLRGERGEVARLPDVARWELGVQVEDSGAANAYVARLVSNDERRWPLLVDHDPVRLLTSLREAVQHSPAAIDGGWGLPAQARPWVFDPASAATAPPRAPSATVWSGSAPLAPRDLPWVTVIMATFVVSDLAYLVFSAGVRFARMHSLSLLLPTYMGLALVLLAAGLSSARVRLSVGAEVTGELRALGFTWRRATVPSDSVRELYAIGTGEARLSHLLVESSVRPLAVPVRPEHLPELLHGARHALAARRTKPTS